MRSLSVSNLNKVFINNKIHCFSEFIDRTFTITTLLQCKEPEKYIYLVMRCKVKTHGIVFTTLHLQAGDRGLYSWTDCSMLFS